MRSKPRRFRNRNSNTVSSCVRSRSLRIESLEDRRLLATVPDGFTETVVASDLTSPITFDIEESGRIWLAYQDGRIEVIEDDVLQPQVFQLDADGSGERGLQGIELDPDFETNHYIYVYYTAASPESHNRLSRLTVDPLTENSIIPESEVALLDLPGFSTFPQNTDPIWHMGGAIHFMEDDTIAVQVGDHLNNSLVQEMSSPLGKVLRVNKDGTPADDNPLYDAGDGIGWEDYVWASGLRNPFSGDIDPVTGRYFINDVGEVTWEEINDATDPGHNFGWPVTEGMFEPSSFPDFTNPVLAYDHAADCAITGGAFNSYATAPVAAFPAEYDGHYFYSQFCAGQILIVDPDNPDDVETFATGAAFPMNIEFGPDGSMYYIARGAGAGGAPGIGTGQVLKVQYASDVAPQIIQHPDDQLVSAGYDATFTASAAGTPVLSYQWQKDDGDGFVDITDATEATLHVPAAMIDDDGTQYRVIVSNGIGTATSNAASLNVTTDTPPTANILLPTDGAEYRGGDLIEFSGTAADAEDGPLGAASMTWQIDFHHDEHSHPFFPPTSGIADGQFEVPVNSETSSNVWFRIHLAVTDSAGLTTESVRDVFPVTTDFTVETNIEGVEVIIDGQPKQTPEMITGVVNVNRSIEAQPAANADGSVGQFVQWLDGETSLQRTIATPEDDRAYVAIYESIPSTMVFLSDLVPSNDPPPNGWGPLELDTSNGEDSPGDGIPMSIENVHFSRGLGVHADSDVRYSLGGAYTRFLADIGVDDETGDGGSVQFQVFGDGEMLYQSNTREGDDDRISLDIDVAGVNELQLVVNNAGDGFGLDHANWSNARLLAAGTGEDRYFNFQPSGTPIAGYTIDSGIVFGEQRGLPYEFGWSSEQTATDRNSFGVEELLESGILVDPNAYWEVEVPDGSYAVTVAVGDSGPGNDTNNTVNVEGTSLWNELDLDDGEFAVESRIVQVTDGRLTVDVGSSGTTRLDYLEIVPLPESDAGMFPFFAADVDLNGRLSLADVLDFAAGWGLTHEGGTPLDQLVRLGDLDFDGDTDIDDWNVLSDRWLQEQGYELSLDAVLNPLPGDYDRNGIVDALDNDLWRATYGSTDEMAADGNGDSFVNAADFVVWRNNLGASIDSNGSEALGETSSEVVSDTEDDSFVPSQPRSTPLFDFNLKRRQRIANSPVEEIRRPQVAVPDDLLQLLVLDEHGNSTLDKQTAPLDEAFATSPGQHDATPARVATPLRNPVAKFVR